MNTASNLEGQSSNHLIHGSQRVLIGKPSAPAKMGGARGLQNPPGTAPPASGRRQYSPLYNRNQRTAESPGCQISTKIQTSEVSRFQFSKRGPRSTILWVDEVRGGVADPAMGRPNARPLRGGVADAGRGRPMPADHTPMAPRLFQEFFRKWYESHWENPYEDVLRHHLVAPSP